MVSGPARAYRFEITADVLALGESYVMSGQYCGNQPCLQRRTVNFLLNQLLQHSGALGVTDQHNAPTFVPMRQIVIPGGTDVLESQIEIRRRRSAQEPGYRSLPVYGCEWTALASEASELLSDCKILFQRMRHQVGVRQLVLRDRRIHVEAVDGCILRRAPRFLRKSSVRVN